MDRRPERVAAGDRVYYAIKARAIAYEFPQGRRIYLEPLADSLGVSTTPVREALNRLAAEDLVVKAPRKGFIGITLSRENILGHYEQTQRLLIKELEELDAETHKTLPEYEPIAAVLFKLNRRVISNAGTLAAYTGQIFYDIALLGENCYVIRAIERANDALYYVRTIECEHIVTVQENLKLFGELLLAGRCEELAESIHDYHDKRLRMLPKLLNQS